MSLFNAIRTLVTSGHRKYNREKPLCLYRCTECGYLAFTVGGLHGHIEGHRRIWNFWRIGWDVDYLQDRTERLWLAEYDPEIESVIDWRDAGLGSVLKTDGSECATDGCGNQPAAGQVFCDDCLEDQPPESPGVLRSSKRAYSEGGDDA